MGGGNFGRDVTPRATRRSLVETREAVFRHEGHATAEEARRPDARREVHPLLNIHGKKKLECRDSKEHPNSMAIGIDMDVTRSRGNDAAIVYEKIPGFIGRLVMTGLVKHPTISWGAIGDATSGDHAPVQIGQFEADKRIDEVLSKVWLEEGGGGTGKESYELNAFYRARCSQLDCVKKRGEKGLLFITGDESPYPKVAKDQVKAWLGIDIPQSIPTPQIFAELQKLYDVFFIYPRKRWEDRQEDVDAEIQGRVRNAGGMLEGVDIRASLLWNNRNDLDLHVICPSGEEIYYGHMRSRCGGVLDVDRNVSGETMKPVENIRWEKGKAPKGLYRVFVRNYSVHGGFPCATDFRVEIEIGGKVKQFTGKTPTKVIGEASDTEVLEFNFDPDEGMLDDAQVYAAYKPEVVIANWSNLLPAERVLVIEDPNSVIDAMLGAIAITRGGQGLDEYLEYLKVEVEQDAARIKDVKSALKALASVGPTTAVENVFDKKKPTKRIGSKRKKGGTTTRLKK